MQSPLRTHMTTRVLILVSVVCVVVFAPVAKAQRDQRSVLVGRATAAITEGRFSDAEQALEQALALDPTMSRARMVLGQMRYRLKDLPGAIRAYEAVVAEEPGNTEAAATLDRWRRELELHDRMQLAVGSHFAVSFEGPAEAALASKVIESLDRSYWRIGDTLGAYPTELLPVVLYTEQQFQDITRSPSWAAGAYDGTIRVPVRGALERTEELDRILAHEFTHALVHSIVPRRIPTWFDEGLATALESADLSWAERRLHQASAAIPLSALAGSFGGLSSTDALTAYAESALALRQLLNEAGGFAVANLLHDLADGVTFDEAFGHRIQRSLAEFEKAPWPTDWKR
jgi:tetratricopeptide (TPR) repeat protein